MLPPTQDKDIAMCPSLTQDAVMCPPPPPPSACCDASSPPSRCWLGGRSLGGVQQGHARALHALIKVLGETKVAARARARGRQASDNELGVVISQIRKYLTTSFIRAQSLCLLNRICFLGEGQRQQLGDGTWLRGCK
jgi:hypothetical protein